MKKLKFKIGNTVTTDPSCDEEIKGFYWLDDWRNKPMTIKSVPTNEYQGYYVKENGYLWDKDWLIKLEEFITEEEFMV